MQRINLMWPLRPLWQRILLIATGVTLANRMVLYQRPHGRHRLRRGNVIDEAAMLRRMRVLLILVMIGLVLAIMIIVAQHISITIRFK